MLIAAAAPVSLSPGLWQVRSQPSGATLDGRRLADLPYTETAEATLVCLSSSDDPAAWLARDLDKGCILTRRVVTAGRIDLSGTCPPATDGLPRGAVRLTGRYTAVAFMLRFTTSSPSENGVMGFTGTTTGRRVGTCQP